MEKTRKTLMLLIMLNFLIIFAAGFMMPVWAQFVKKIGGDLRTAGNAICLFSIVLGFFTWVAARIENYYKKNSWVILFAQLLFVLSYSGYFFVDSPLSLYLVQIFLGLSGAIQAPALFALYEQYIPKDQSTFYWGIWAGSYNIAIGTGALISAYTVHHFGFKAMFSLLLISSIICFIFTTITVKLIAMTEIPSDKA